MARLQDVVAYVLQNTGPVTTMKLQKLIYYCQAWSLVWDDQPLFTNKIEAWANGPVIPDLYAQHRGLYQVGPGWWTGDGGNLSETERDTVDAVLKFYGSKSSQWLSDLTHSERPWLEARAGAAPGEPSHGEISLAAMAEYYGSL